METYLVWCTEYPEDGSDAFTTYTAKGAMRAYRKATGERCSRDDLTPLSVAEATPEIMAQRAAECA